MHDEWHEFGSIHIVHYGAYSYHARDCIKCGIQQEYGHRYGSRKHARFQPIDLYCPGVAEDDQSDSTQGEEHEFGRVYIVHTLRHYSSYAHHERTCLKCGIRQQYGHAFGSRRKAGYGRIDMRCNVIS